MSAVPVSRRVLVVWAGFITLAAIIAAVEGGAFSSTDEVPVSGRQRVFSFSEADLGAVEILYQGRSARFLRDDMGQWLRHDAPLRHGAGAADDDEHHHDHERDPEAIAEQLRISARMLADRRVSPDRSLSEYGLESPAATIAFYARGGDPPAPLARLYVGDLLTTGYSYYTRLDGDPQLTLLPRYQVALLLALAFGPQVAPSPMPEHSGGVQ